MTTGQQPDDEAAVEQARLIRELQEHPGWSAFVTAVEQHERDVQTGLLFGKAKENPAEYATKVGEMKGLRVAVQVADSAVARGQAAAERIRDRQNTPAEEAA